MKNDSTEDAAAIHAFMSEHIYLFLQCESSFEYTISYAFSNCPFEAEVRSMFNQCLLDNSFKEVSLVPNFTTYLTNVKRHQHPKHFYNL